jgi:Fe-S-cluster containining protein
MDKGEIQRIARFLKIPTEEFLQQFCRHVLLRISLIERPNGDCIFFTPAGCSIYPARPVQCRSYPFWSDSLRSQESWEALKARCPGVGTGKLYSLREIHAIRDGTRSTGE